ncbi:MAG: AAA family ATPase [Candidatus Hodarchaeales archaeon]|jgi:dephospho-CoA kinase
MKIIILTGLPASGKTVHAKIVGAKLGIPSVETGTFVFQAVRKKGFEITPENIAEVSSELKAQSDSFFTERAIEYIESYFSTKPAVFLSGVRAESEVDFLRKRFGEKNVFLIGFHASRPTRFARMFNPDRMESSGEVSDKRAEDEALRDFSNFVARDKKELSFGVGDLLASSDYLMNLEDQRWPFHIMARTMIEFEQVVRAIVTGMVIRATSP